MTWMDKAISAFDADKKAAGDMLSHDWIAWALDLPEPQTVADAKRHGLLLMSRFEAFREHLLTERKLALANVRGEGYIILRPGDQAHHAAMTWAKEVSKAARRAEATLRNARVDEMTDDERRRHLDTEVRISGVSALLKREKKNVIGRFLK